MLSLGAGGTIPETSVTVSNGQGQQITRAHIAGHKTPVTVVQRLWLLKDGVGSYTESAYSQQLVISHPCTAL